MTEDTLEGLLDFDTNNDDIFRDVDISMDLPSRRKSSPLAENSKDLSGLGIDEEVQVQKKRKPIVQLNEHRLLSPSGIPKLRHISQKQLRLKGKGHEFSDIGRLLNMYQLWLDALYPRAKFGDGLAIIEKLGHTKRMQLLRRDWINESKVQATKNEASKDDQSPASPVEKGESQASKFHSHQSNLTLTADSTIDGGPNAMRSSTIGHRSDWPLSQEDPNEDLFVSEKEDGESFSQHDLDAIRTIEDIIEDPGTSKSKNRFPQTSSVAIERSGAEFDEEMEAMASMGNL